MRLGDFMGDAQALGTLGTLGHHHPGGLGPQAAVADIGEHRFVGLGTGLAGALQVEISVFHFNSLSRYRLCGAVRAVTEYIRDVSPDRFAAGWPACALFLRHKRGTALAIPRSCSGA